MAFKRVMEAPNNSSLTYFSLLRICVSSPIGYWMGEMTYLTHLMNYIFKSTCNKLILHFLLYIKWSHLILY